MHNNYFFLKHLSAELHELLVGYKLLSCFSQERDELILEFGLDQKQVFIKATLKPEFSCINVYHHFSRARKNTVDLWPELFGNDVTEIKVFDNERAFCIYIQNNISLVFKMYGNRPNLLIYKNEELEYLFNNSLISDRNLKFSDFNKSLEINPITFASNGFDIQKTVPTLGKIAIDFFNNLIKNQPASDIYPHLDEFLANLRKPTFYIGKIKNKPVLSLFEPEHIESKYTAAIEAINAFNIFYQKEFYFFNEKQKIQKNLEKEKEKTLSYIKKTSQKLSDLLEGLNNEQTGHLIMAHLHLDFPENGVLEIFDFYNNQNTKIKLKKDLSLQKNAETFYRKSKNEKIEIENLENSIVKAQARLKIIEENLYDIGELDDFKSLRFFQKKLISEQPAEQSSPQFKVFNLENWVIWVGKNAKNNDILTQKYTQKDDYWLHARDTSGSHVVVKNPTKSKLPDHISEQAASIAAYFSKRNTESLVPVIITQKKYVRKARNLKAGQVKVEKESVIIVPPILPD